MLFFILDCHSGIFNTLLLVTRKIEQSLAAAAFHVVGGDKMSLLFLIFSSDTTAFSDNETRF